MGGFFFLKRFQTALRKAFLSTMGLKEGKLMIWQEKTQEKRRDEANRAESWVDGKRCYVAGVRRTKVEKMEWAKIEAKRG